MQVQLGGHTSFEKGLSSKISYIPNWFMTRINIGCHGYGIGK